MSGLTPSKLDTLLFLPCVTAPLSVLGSSVVLTCIFRHSREKRSTVYHRLLAGLSALDIIFSVAYSFGPLPIPSSYQAIGLKWSHGTIATCAAQGFLLQFGYFSYGYSMCLCLYYVLTIRYNLPERLLAKWVEPIMHLCVLAFAATSAILNVALEFANPGMGVCWISANPPFCGSGPEYPYPCIRGEGFEAFAKWVLLYPSIIMTMAIAACLALVVVTILQQRRKIKRFLFPKDNKYKEDTANAASSSYGWFGLGRTTTATTTNAGSSQIAQSKIEASNDNEQGILQMREEQQQGDNSNYTNKNENQEEQHMTIRIENTTESSTSTSAHRQPQQNRQRLSSSMTEQRMDTVITQCLLYGANFFMANVWLSLQCLAVILDVGDLYTTWYPILILANVFNPLQGFFNALIFLRPRYALERRRHGLPPCTALKNAIWYPTRKYNIATMAGCHRTNHNGEQYDLSGNGGTANNNDVNNTKCNFRNVVTNSKLDLPHSQRRLGHLVVSSSTPQHSSHLEQEAPSPAPLASTENNNSNEIAT